jgi:hypothetical protein
MRRAAMSTCDGTEGGGKGETRKMHARINKKRRKERARRAMTTSPSPSPPPPPSPFREREIERTEIPRCRALCMRFTSRSNRRCVSGDADLSNLGNESWHPLVLVACDSIFPATCTTPSVARNVCNPRLGGVSRRSAWKLRKVGESKMQGLNCRLGSESTSRSHNRLLFR